MNLQMDGAVPGVQGVEYDGWSAVRTGIIRYGSRAVCGSGFADGGTGKTGWRAGKAGQLDEIELSDTDRTRTGFAELDRVLGSGVVRGSLVLVGGDPGIGKSTLLLQVCRNLAGQEQKGFIRLRRGVIKTDQTAGKPDRDGARTTFVLE